MNVDLGLFKQQLSIHNRHKVNQDITIMNNRHCKCFFNVSPCETNPSLKAIRCGKSTRPQLFGCSVLNVYCVGRRGDPNDYSCSGNQTIQCLAPLFIFQLCSSNPIQIAEVKQFLHDLTCNLTESVAAVEQQQVPGIILRSSYIVDHPEISALQRSFGHIIAEWLHDLREGHMVTRPGGKCEVSGVPAPLTLSSSCPHYPHQILKSVVNLVLNRQQASFLRSCISTYQQCLRGTKTSFVVGQQRHLMQFLGSALLGLRIPNTQDVNYCLDGDNDPISGVQHCQHCLHTVSSVT